jgi:hypothetical protein
MASFDVMFSAFSLEFDADCESELVGVSAATTCEEETGGTICKSWPLVCTPLSVDANGVLSCGRRRISSRKCRPTLG